MKPRNGPAFEEPLFPGYVFMETEKLGISKAKFDENQRIVIVDGPLKDFEGRIIRVNRRCKRVTVEIDMFGYSKKVDLCYEDVQGVEWSMFFIVRKVGK